jgi:hypothetical protein
MTGAASAAAVQPVHAYGALLTSVPNHFSEMAFRLPSAAASASALFSACLNADYPSGTDAHALDRDLRTGLDRQPGDFQQIGRHQAIVERGVDAAGRQVRHGVRRGRIAAHLHARHRLGLLLVDAALPHAQLFALQIGQRFVVGLSSLRTISCGIE